MAKQEEEDSRKAHPELDTRAQDRITELLKANEQLRHEIAERDRALEALREQEERYRGLLETMEEAYFEVDLKGRFTFLNDSWRKMHRLAKNELLGLSYKQYMDKETAEKVYHVFKQIYNTGQPAKSFEFGIIRRDRQQAILETSIYLMKNSQGEPIGFRGIGRDITERKRTEEALRESEKTAKRLAQENAVMAEIGRIISSKLRIEEVYELFAAEARKLI